MYYCLVNKNRTFNEDILILLLKMLDVAYEIVCFRDLFLSINVVLLEEFDISLFLRFLIYR